MPLKSAKMVIPRFLSAFRSRPGSETRTSILDGPQKILLVKQGERLGNIVLLNSAIAGLAAAFPDVNIDLMLPAIYADVMRHNTAIKNIHSIEKRRFIRRPWSLLTFLRRLRQEEYDLAIDCSDVNSHSSTGAAYTLLSGAKLTAGWEMGKSRIFDIEVPRYTEPLHSSFMYIKLISGIYRREFDGDPYFEDVFSTSESLSMVGINCGGRGPKRWPLDDFIQVGRLLSGQGITADFILGPDEERLRRSLESRLPAGARLLPLLPPGKLMEFIAGYKLFISSDTGPMHLAWSLKVPVIAIFTDSELEKFKPLSPGSVVIDGRNGVAPGEIFEIALRSLRSAKVPV